MDFNREDFIKGIYETSKSSKDNTALLEPRDDRIEVYCMDDVKEWFCGEYRDGENLASCDAYYQSEHDYLVMEFKNTNHRKLKKMMGDIRKKISDTHMLLLETFLRTQKRNFTERKVELVLVYNDALSLDPGIMNISRSLNSMQPIRGDRTRRSNAQDFYEEESQYIESVNRIKQKYEKDFFKEIRFMDVKDFREEYIEGTYFNNLR